MEPAAPRHRQAGSIPVILDTDIGGDIDDTWALAMILGQPRLDLRLVTTAFDNTPEKARLVAKILACAVREDIPIGAGPATSSDPLTHGAWLEGFDLGQYRGRVEEDGVGLLIDTIQASPPPVTLLVIGPATNIAEALRRDPGIAPKTRLVAMAGSIDRGPAGQEGAIPEWNVKCDIPAFRAVMDAPWAELVLTPLDGCGDMVLSGERYARLLQSGNSLARLVLENYAVWSMRHHHPEDSSSILFDTVAVYLAMDDALCEMTELRLKLDEEGYSRPDENGRSVRCQLGWKDREAFQDLLVESLTGAGTR